MVQVCAAPVYLQDNKADGSDEAFELRTRDDEGRC